MDCKKAQRVFDDLSHDRLSPEDAVAIRQHLADCTDCRVLQQREARLQRLLALKRYERPAPQYFDNFLAEFHKRLSVELQPSVPWWDRMIGGIDEILSAESMQVWRYALASALGVTMIVGLMWTGVRDSDETNDGTAAFTANSSVALLSPIAAPSSTDLPADDQLATTDTQPVLMRGDAESATPQYVLDRISVTPASYDVASVHF